MIMNDKNRFATLYFLVLLSVILLIHSLFFQQEVEEFTYAQFKRLVQESPQRIEQCIITPTHIRGVYIKDNDVFQRHLKQLEARAKLQAQAKLEAKQTEAQKVADTEAQKIAVTTEASTQKTELQKAMDTQTTEAQKVADITEASTQKTEQQLVPSTSETEQQIVAETPNEEKNKATTLTSNQQKRQPFHHLMQLPEGRKSYNVVRVFDDPNLVKFLEENKVPFQGEVDNNWLAILLSWLLPLGLLVAFWVFFMRRMSTYGRDIMSFGKTQAKITAEHNTKTTFHDVAGCDEAKEELGEIVDFLKSPKKFEQLGGKIPKGALLVGPPGTGKTLLARAVAGEANVPFFHISGSEFVEMFVGVGASRVRNLFQQAKSKPPCIIFIDEIDAVGRQRGAGLSGGHDEREQTLNQLLTEMDGFETNKGIIVLAATNRPDILDHALLRPGRFDRRVTIGPPDIKGREEILKIHARGKPMDKDIVLKQLAQRTPGFSGADLASVMNEAALLAARKGKKIIQQDDLAEAIERVMAGPQLKSRIISDQERKITAFHEVGHAIIHELHPHANPVHKVSIIPRGSALGYTMSMPEEDKYNKTKDEILAEICCFLAGRIAEEVEFGIMSTGASNDFQHVSNLARSMIARYGMSKTVGPMAFEAEERELYIGKRSPSYSNETLQTIDQETRQIVEECYNYTRSLLETHKENMRKIVDVILEKETLEGDEFRKLLNELIPDIPEKYNLLDQKAQDTTT
ncbi:MAG TPA: ATP-dependent zinc metalloprotease FtsH [Planctomycetota bacterium]|jgi:cell division protease FtsH|nr:ATP-dependent zinc metalloprotease FtsH [Planctomycetota bacterium]